MNRDKAIKLLRGGPEGIATWNKTRPDTPHLECAELDHAALEHADLDRAELDGADLDAADLRDCHLVGASLQGVELEAADLRGADLEGANLWGANLQNANLQGANLRNANLAGADLRRANLVGANLEGVQGAGDGAGQLAGFLGHGQCSGPDRTRRLARGRWGLCGVTVPKLHCKLFLINGLQPRAAHGRDAP